MYKSLLKKYLIAFAQIFLQKMTVVTLCVAFFLVAGCGKQNNIEVDNEVCKCISVENFEKPITEINDWLSRAPMAWNLHVLPNWLEETYPCIVYSKTLYVSNESGKGEVALMFEEEGKTKTLILEMSITNLISLGNPFDIVSFEEFDITREKEYPIWKVESYFDYFYNCDLCLNFDQDNIEKSIPLIDEFLSILPENLPEERKIRELEYWLNIQPCIGEKGGAKIENFSVIKSNPPTGEIIICLENENSDRIFKVMDISWTNPMTISRFHEYDPFYEHTGTEKPVEVPLTVLWKFEYLNYYPLFFSDYRKVLIINSKEDLKSIITNTDGYPEIDIDFSKQTLLLAYGYDGFPYYETDPIVLQKYSSGFVLNFDRWTKSGGDIKWQVALATNKIPKESNIEIKINYVSSNKYQ